MQLDIQKLETALSDAWQNVSNCMSSDDEEGAKKWAAAGWAAASLLTQAKKIGALQAEMIKTWDIAVAHMKVTPWP